MNLGTDRAQILRKLEKAEDLCTSWDVSPVAYDTLEDRIFDEFSYGYSISELAKSVAMILNML